MCVWAVLQDPSVDYRLVVAGALLPDLVDGPWGAARVGHALVAGVGLLMAVMLATHGRRRLRRRLLALPIGVLVHLVLDGMWTNTHVFWWPFLGWSLPSTGGLPSLAHPVALTVAEEIAGAAAIGWCWVRFGLSHPGRRRRLLRTGRLAPDVGPRGGAGGLPSPRRPGPRG